MSFKIGIREFDRVLKQALERTYSYSPKFNNESDFKHELFHQLHGMEINGYKLGEILPSYKTSMLHSEARPRDGLNRKADILICNPTVQRSYNYRTEVVIELKETLDETELNKELSKFSEYNNGIRKLYIVSANNPKIDRGNAKRVASGHNLSGASIEVFDRSSISHTPASQSRRRGNAKTPLSERVAKCVTTTLNLYGKNREDIYHSFFWRNYEYHEGEWTFPCEGDFVAQLYNRLRVEFGRTVDIHTEYRALPRKRVDLFIGRQRETVGIEVKINYDNLFRGKEISNLSEKFDAMSDDYDKHTNFLVVIQGAHAYRGNHRDDSLRRLRQSGSDLRLFHYDEIRNKAIGPISVREAQKLAIR